MQPPFSITENMMNTVVDITRLVTILEIKEERNLKLRKENRIQAIHSSLLIENSSLTLEQVTAIIEGKKVLGNPREIKEIQNAYNAYEEILKLEPYNEKDFLKAHALLTDTIIGNSGSYRQSDVGIYDAQGNVVHVGARPQFISELMHDLFAWGKRSSVTEVIRSCVFHYEIEVIHPFEDGNGRMGRLWQNVILTHWNPIFAWIPVETLIYENQAEYYRQLAMADSQNDSTKFIEFMLSIIYKSLSEYELGEKNIDNRTQFINLTEKESISYQVLHQYLQTNPYITTKNAAELLEVSEPTIRRYMKKYVDEDLLVQQGENKNRRYTLKK